MQLWLTIIVTLVGVLLAVYYSSNRSRFEVPAVASSCVLSILCSIFLLITSFGNCIFLESELMFGPGDRDSRRFSTDRGTSAVVSGVISSGPVHQETEYAAYAEYDNSGKIIDLQLGHHCLEVTLDDGTIVRFEPGLEPKEEWGWREDSNFRYVLPGENVRIAGKFTLRKDGESGQPVLVPYHHTEYIFLGNDDDFFKSEFGKKKLNAASRGRTLLRLQLGGALLIILILVGRRRRS